MVADAFGLKRHRHFDVKTSVVDTARLLEALKTFATDLLLLNANLSLIPFNSLLTNAAFRSLENSYGYLW